MKTEINVIVKTNKQVNSKTIYKENIDDLYNWCEDSKDFLIDNIKNTGEELDNLEFNFPGIGARYAYQFAYRNSFSVIQINSINLTYTKTKKYLNQEVIDYCAKIKQRITPATLQAYLKQLVNQYGKHYYTNEYRFKIPLHDIFYLNYDGWSATIDSIQKIDGKYYLLIWWDNGNTDCDDIIPLDSIKVGSKETKITSTVYNKTFTFETENLRNMIALILLNQKLGI